MLVTDIEIETKTRDQAYAMWEAEGRPEGRAVDHWLAAEAKCQPDRQSNARANRLRRTSSGTMDGAPVNRSSRSASTARKAKTSSGSWRQPVEPQGGPAQRSACSKDSCYPASSALTLQAPCSRDHQAEHEL